MKFLVLLVVSFFSLADCRNRRRLPDCSFLRPCISGVKQSIVYETLMPIGNDFVDLCSKAVDMRDCSWSYGSCMSKASDVDVHLAFRIGQTLCQNYQSGYYVAGIDEDSCGMQQLPNRASLIEGFKSCLGYFKLMKKEGYADSCQLATATVTCLTREADVYCGTAFKTFYQYLFESRDCDLQNAIFEVMARVYK